MLDLHIQNELEDSNLPSQQQFETWINAALLKEYEQLEQLLRITDGAEIQTLNKEYRGKDKVTNILSFSAEQYEFLEYDCLGDLVVCASVVAKEAADQNKQLHDHWAHLIVHGMLHLQGFDHVDNAEAIKMEALEVKILETIGIANPYNADMLNYKSME